jgi:hypothetical protein
MPKGSFAVGTEDLEDVALALRYEEDGTRLRRALSKELRTAVEPAISKARGSIMSMGSAGLAHKGEPLRASIAEAVKANTRLAGRSAGVRVRVTTKGMPRGFKWAARRTNRAKGWRHPVPIRRKKDEAVGATEESDVWVHQTGKIGWFDDSMRDSAPAALTAVQKVVGETADRIRKGA